jgi:hypothetical protein
MRWFVLRTGPGRRDATSRANPGGIQRPHLARDRDLSFVELLVAIVLLGMGVVTTLVALRASTAATIIDREHAKAFEQLQAAADEVYNAPRVPCYAPEDPVVEHGAAIATAQRPRRLGRR